MGKLLLKLKSGIKVKNVLPLLWNYTLFSCVFNNILNFPQYTLLLASMQQKEIYKMKKFLFYKLKNLSFTLMLTKFLVSKNKKSSFYNNFFFSLFIDLFFQILDLIFSQIFSFIPFQFRVQNLKFSLNIMTKVIKPFYLISLSQNSKFSFLIKTSFKFLKKFVNDIKFGEYYLEIINFFFRVKISETSFVFTNILKFKSLLNFMHFFQFDAFIYFITAKFSFNLNKHFQSRYKKLFFLLKISLQNISKKTIFVYDMQEQYFLKRKKTFFSSFGYLRMDNFFLIYVFAPFSTFVLLKKQIHDFNKYIFNLSNESLIKLNLLGFDIIKSRVVVTTIKQKITCVLKKKNFLTTRLLVPLKTLKTSFIKAGLLNVKYVPIYFEKLITFDSDTIFNWYLQFYFVFLNYYSKCLNFESFKLRFYYICKWSLLFTFAKKYKKTLKYVFSKYISQITNIFINRAMSFYLINNIKTKKTQQTFFYIYKDSFI